LIIFSTMVSGMCFFVGMLFVYILTDEKIIEPLKQENKELKKETKRLKTENKKLEKKI